MKSFFSLGFFSLLFFCCTHKEMKDSSVLSKKQMTDIMWDLLRADVYVQDFLLKDSAKNKKDESFKLYDEIFFIHHVTVDQFKKSLGYYQSNPTYFQPIIDSLVKKQRETTRPVLPHVVRDSFQHMPGKQIQKQ